MGSVWSMLETIMMSLWFLFFSLLSLISVAYFTLLERNYLGLIQERLGPNKVGFAGVLQPMSDGVSLFLSEIPVPLFSMSWVFFFSPLLGFFVSVYMLVIYPWFFCSYDFSMGVVFFMCLIAFMVYPMMMMGWAVCSKYGLLGSQRSVAQSISYEVSLGFLLLVLLVLFMSYSFCTVRGSVVEEMYLLSLPIFFVWFMVMLAESNRSPFDLAEGESELVSGFNIEYGGGGFAFISILEYLSLISLCMVTVMLFFSFSLNIYLVLLLMYFFLWVRSTFPRLRYDRLMDFMWSGVLPFVIFYFLFVGFLGNL